MIKKISYLIISVAIIAAGAIGFSKLSYSQRSARIFSYNSNNSPTGRMDERPRGESGSPGLERSGFDRERGNSRDIDRNMPDSLRKRPEGGDRERMGRGSFEGRPGGSEGRGRGDFQGGQKVNLRNIPWFLAVFAAFTVVAIYIDRGWCLIRGRRVANCSETLTSSENHQLS